MARANRTVVPNGTYHVTSRIVNCEMWLADHKLKDYIVEDLLGIAKFSGVKLLAWMIMDNHFHIFVHVPEVPKRYRLDPNSEPAAYAFGMRPAECNPSLWQPNSRGDSPQNNSRGDRPQKASQPRGDSPSILRPETGFTLPDEEMLERLQALYGNKKRIECLRAQWAHKRSTGQDNEVDCEKDRFCRRMYNLTQFVKTFKERIAWRIKKANPKHTGHIFGDRFYSGLVEGKRAVREFVALYIDNNAVRAGIVNHPAQYSWCSFAKAVGTGPSSAECRKGYETVWGGAWEEVRPEIEAALNDRLPEAVRDAVLKGKQRARPTQLIHLSISAVSHGAYIASKLNFARTATACLAQGFRRAGVHSLRRLCSIVEWDKVV